MRIRQVLTTAAVLVLSAGVFAACGDDDKPTVADSNTTAVTDASGATTLTLIATDFEFDKTTATSGAGKPLNLVFQNNGTVTHNLTIRNANVDMDAVVDATETQTISPPAGTYDYFCEYHPAKMKGKLTVK